MEINKIILRFLTSFSLIYINPGAANFTTPYSGVSCQAPGTVNFNINDTAIKSVLVECDYKGNDIMRTIPKGSPSNNISVSNCTINKPVKLVFFNVEHDASLGAVIREEKSHLVTEIIVICDGTHMTVNQSFSNSVLAPTALTNIPLRETLTMKVTDETGNNPTPAVNIAHAYKLRITGPDDLFLLVESCDAASDLSFKNNLVTLYVNRKPNDDYGVLGTFSNNITKTTEATMVGFRLVDSPVVYLRCVVDVCNEAGCPSLTTSTTTTAPTTTTTTTAPTTTTTTATSRTTQAARSAPISTAALVGRKRRRRRDVNTTNRRVTLSTSFRVEPLFTTSGVNGSTVVDRRYAFIVCLLLAKYFLFFR